MRAALSILFAAMLAGCSGGLTQRQPLAEVPIGTAATPATTSTTASSDSSDSSSSGMVAAKIDETEAKKPPAAKPEPASAKPRGGAAKKSGGKRH